MVLLALLGLVVAFFGAMFAGVIHLFRSSSAYRASLDFVESQPAVIAELGSPIEDGLMPTGSITSDGRRADSRISIRLHGARADGWAQVISHRESATWIIDDAKLEVSGRVIRLTP